MKDREIVSRLSGGTGQLGDAYKDHRWLGVKMPSITVSTPSGGPCRSPFGGVVVATMERLKGTSLGIDMNQVPQGEMDPAWNERELTWASVTHNARTPQGANYVVSRLLGQTANSVVSNGVGTTIALGKSTQIATATTDKSISSSSLGVSTNEFATGLGYSRSLTSNVYTIASTPGSNDGTILVTILHAFTNGTEGTVTVNGSAVFDQVTVAASNMWVADLFASALPTVNTDVINVTWSLTL